MVALFTCEMESAQIRAQESSSAEVRRTVQSRVQEDALQAHKNSHLLIIGSASTKRNGETETIREIYYPLRYCDPVCMARLSSAQTVL